VLTPLLQRAHKAYAARRQLVAAADDWHDSDDEGHASGKHMAGDEGDDGTGSESGSEEEDDEESDSDDSGDDDYRTGGAFGSGQVAPGGGHAVRGSTAEAAPDAAGDAALATFEALLRPWRVVSPLCKGTALFAVGCQMNHSCVPNVQLCYARGDMVAAAVAQTEIAPGDELCINYVGLRQGYADRQRRLRHYGFVCKCPRCVAEVAEEEEEEEEGAQE
jgi:hypothetical protein